jgi:hypothetical protein
VAQATLDDCEAYCESTAGCEFFTHDAAAQVCTPFSGAATCASTASTAGVVYCY